MLLSLLEDSKNPSRRHLLSKKELQPSATLDPPLAITQMTSILLKTRINRGNHDRK